jgi:hypothetical protein
MRLTLNIIPKNRSLITTEPYTSKSSGIVKFCKTLAKFPFWFVRLIKNTLLWTVFGLDKWFYITKFIGAAFLTWILYYFGREFGFASPKFIGYILVCQFLYPYARFVFDPSGRYNRYAERGVTITMTKQQYDNAMFWWSLVPYFFSPIIAPFSWLWLWILGWAEHREKLQKQ